MEFAEFVGFAIKSGKIFFAEGFLHAGFDVIPEDASENEWFYKGLMNHWPEDDATEYWWNNGETSDAGDPFGSVGVAFYDGLTCLTKGIWEIHKDKIEDTRKYSADDEKWKEAHTKYTSKVFG